MKVRLLHDSISFATALMEWLAELLHAAIDWRSSPVARFGLLPCRYGLMGGGGLTANRDRFVVTPQRKGPTWISVHITWFCRSWKTAGWHSWLRKNPNDWRTLPRSFVTFHWNYFSRFPSTNCRQFVSNLWIVCALCAQWLKSFRMDVSFRQMSSLEEP